MRDYRFMHPMVFFDHKNNRIEGVAFRVRNHRYACTTRQKKTLHKKITRLSKVMLRILDTPKVDWFTLKDRVS